MDTELSGYREIEHTADWELEVWAPDLAGLLEQAARGMYKLAGVRLAAGPRQAQFLVLDASDPEALLVVFLSELLYLGEQEGLGVEGYNLSIDELNLAAELNAVPLEQIEKEIKAVTFHNLKIQKSPHGLETRIVFDV